MFFCRRRKKSLIIDDVNYDLHRYLVIWGQIQRNPPKKYEFLRILKCLSINSKKLLSAVLEKIFKSS